MNRSLALMLSIIIILLNSCGGGGGSNSSGGGTDKKYTIALDKSEIKLDVNFNMTSTVATVRATFKGDGVIVGYPVGVQEVSGLKVQLLNQTSSTVDVVFFVEGTRFLSLNSFSVPIRFVTGAADGSETVFKDITVTIQQKDGLDVSANPIQFSEVWGGDATTNTFEVENIASNWTISSSIPGINFSPSSGTGKSVVVVSYDYQQIPIGTSSAFATVSLVNGTKKEKNISFALSAPKLVQPSTKIAFRAPEFVTNKQKFEIPIEYQGSAKKLSGTWSVALPDWLAADKLSGNLGEDKLIVQVNEKKLPVDDSLLVENISFVFNVHGQEFNDSIESSLEFQKYRLQPSRSAFAFSDYGTAESHRGSIKVNVPEGEELSAEANQPWIIVDSIDKGSINFHLDVAALEEGFYQSKITISDKLSGGVVPDVVRVGYYKSVAVPEYGNVASVENFSVGVADKLGPWIYFSLYVDPSKGKNTQLAKFNLATHQIESYLTIQNSASLSIDDMTMSDDGNELFIISNNPNQQKQLLTINLESGIQTNWTPIGMTITSGFRYARITGKPVLITRDYGVFDASNGAALSNPVNGAYYPLKLRPIGDVSVVSPAGGAIWVAQHHSYDYLNHSLKTDLIRQFFPINQVELSDFSFDGEKFAASDFIVSNTPVLNSDGSTSSATIKSTDINLYSITGFSNSSILLSSIGVIKLGASLFTPTVLVLSDGRAVIEMTDVWPQKNIKIFDSKQQPLAVYSLGDYHQLDWRFVSADEKMISYLERLYPASGSLFVQPLH